MNNAFWQFRNSAGDANSAELLLYGNISESSWWGDDITPKQFNRDLARLGNVRNLTVRINSYGGDVFAAHAIYNALVQHPANITVRVDGIAASAATIIMLAGTDIIMPENAMIMIHNPWTIAMGDARDMRKAADTLDQVRESILAVYETRTGMSHDELVSMLDAETWMTADEAVTAGFADKVETNEKVKSTYAQGKLTINGLNLDLSKMKMVPVALLTGATNETTSPPEGVGDNPASAAAEQKTQEDITVDGNSQTNPAGAPVPAPAPVAAVAEPTNEQPINAAQIAANERARIVAIQKLATPGAEEIIAAAIENGETAEACAYKILTAESVQNAAALAARKEDAQAAGGVLGGAGASEEDAKEAVVAKMAAAGTNHMKFIRGGGVR